MQKLCPSSVHVWQPSGPATPCLHCRAEVWHKQASRHFARHPRTAEILFYGFMLELPACFLMYLPVIFLWPLWVWWALMLPRLTR